MYQTPRISYRGIPQALALVLLLILPLPAIPGVPPAVQAPAVEARIVDDGQPPLATAVECIRAGANPGDSPQFLTTCFASMWTTGYRSYNRAPGEPLREGDAPATETALAVFGDTKQGVAFGPWPAGQDGPDEYKASPAATVGQIGAVYGLAWSSGRNPAATNGGREPRAYVAAFTKRATRFGDFGPGAIYTRPWSTDPTPQIFVTIPDVVNGPEGAPFDLGGPDATGFQHSQFPNGNPGATVWMGGVHLFEHDTPAITSAGRSSLGDIDLDPQERFLFAVNLNTKRVYQVDTWAAAPQPTVTPLPSLVAQLAPCAGRGGTPNYRPFGLLVTRDHLYLGGVCSAEVSRDRAHLAARVDRIAIDGSGAVRGGWENVLGFGLTDYDAQRNAGVSDRDLRWLPWQDDDQCGAGFAGVARICPQPILADLALDERGHLILGFRDRYADITGSEPLQTAIPAGDIMRAPWDGSRWSAPSTWVGGEVFSDATTMANGGQKAEVASGALAYVPGTNTGAYGGELVTTWLDPYEGSSFGAAWFNAAGGAPTNLQIIYRAPSTRSYYFSKSAGLGDLELQCTWSALGDRVWNDVNGNGVQDASEPGVNGVRVQLFAGDDARMTNLLATVTTGDVDGDGQGGEWRFYVEPFRTYIVRLDPAQFQPGQAFANWSVTRQNQGGDDTRDSDAHPIFRVIDIAAQGDEEQNVAYDFGINQRQPTAQLGDRVWRDDNRNGFQDAGEPGVQGIPVELWACTDITGVDCPSGIPYTPVRTATTDATGHYVFLQLPANFYVVRFPSIPPGFAPTIANAGGDDTRDSDVAPGTDWPTGALAVLPSSVDMMQDLGLVATVSDIRVNLWGPRWVNAGFDRVTYEVQPIGGSTPMRNVVLTVTLPTPVRDVTASHGGSISGSTVTWTLDTLAANERQVLRSVTLTYPQVGSYTPRATISATPPDTDTSNNTWQASTLAYSTNLAIDITGPASIAPDQEATYRVTVSNRETQRGARVPQAFLWGVQGDNLEIDYSTRTTVTLPPEVEVFQGGQWRQQASLTMMHRPTLLSGGAVTYDIRVRLRPGLTTLPDSIAVRGVVETDPLSLRPPPDVRSDETHSVVTTIQQPDLVVGITAQRARVGEGGGLVYTVTTRNDGAETARNVRLEVTLPDGVTLGTPDRGGYQTSNGGRTLAWNLLDTLAAGAAAPTIQIPVTVNTGTGGTNGSIITARAVATTTTPERNVPNEARVDVAVVPPPVVPPTLGVRDGLRLAIHSELDPLSQDGLDTNAVYRSDGAAITWPLGEVLDFTPRASVTLPTITPEEAALYELRARIDRWSIASFTVGGRTLAAATESDVFGRSGCRTGATQQPGLEGCSYAYLDGQDATRSVTAQRLPTETEMAGQAHVMWAANGPASMVEDVYVWRVSGLERVQISVQVLVRVDVVSRDTGTVVRTENRVLTQTYDVTLIAPRSVR